MASSDTNIGHRILPVLVDDIANEDPNRLFCIIPGLSTGTRSVTIADFAHAVNRAALWVEEQFNRGQNFETLAYIGPNDIRYFILLLAAIKVGYKLLLPSARNSIQNHLHVLEATECKILLRASATNVDHILAQRGMRCITVPELEELISSTPVPNYPYRKTFEEAKSEPALVLHSSGSTGPPKPVFYTQGSITTFDAHHLLPSEPDCMHAFSMIPASSHLMITMPFYHLSGLYTGLFLNIYWNIPSVHLPPTAISNADAILDAISNTKVDVALVSPSILEEMSHSSHAVAELGKLSSVWYGGGPLSDYAGNIICKHVNLGSMIGSTEAGIYPTYSHDSREDFAWFRFRPDVAGIEFQERTDGLHELVLTRDSIIDYQTTFYNFPELITYATKDLYRKHPSKPGYWKHVSRVDDVLVLSNGEKLVTVPIENVLHQAPEIKGVIILGHGRFQCAALIELQDGARGTSPKDMIKQLSPYIKHANDNSPGFGRLATDRILFTVPEKPILRTPKGTVIRNATLAAYEKEIDNLYSGTSKDDGLTGPLLKCDDVSVTENTLLGIFKNVADREDLSNEQDVFVAGIDSVQVLTVVRKIKSIVESEAPEHARNVVASLIYSNPTIKQLAVALRGLTHSQGFSREALHARKMEETLEKYSKDIPQAVYTRESDNITVVLTGSTGSLGSYLIDVLISNPSVSKIYALNRATDGKSKQFLANSSRGLSVDFEGKVTFLQTSLGDEMFGLDTKTYKQMSREASVIIHNQWAVDFNLSLDSFQPHIHGVRRLIDFSASSVRHPPIFFTSSVSTTGNWSSLNPDKPIPEQVIGDMRVPFAIGYGESKYISEHLLAAAGSKGISAAVCRVGQLGGPVEKGGMWNKQEWLPSLIASSKYLHLIPDCLGANPVVDWYPVDLMATTIIELITCNLQTPTDTHAEAWTRFYNLVNPHSARWESLIPTVETYIPDAKVVPYGEWLDALRTSASRDEDPVANPSIKLLDFFEGLADGGLPSGFATEAAQGASATMKDMAEVGGEWMETWLKQWNF